MSHAPTVGRRFPLADLTRAARGVGMSSNDVRLAAAMSGSTWTKAMMEGLTVWAADRAAIACGLHPSTVWPDFDVLGDGEPVEFFDQASLLVVAS